MRVCGIIMLIVGVAGLTGCATFPVEQEPPPVPVGPAPAPPRVSLPPRAPTQPARPPGWDSPEPYSITPAATATPKPMDGEVMRLQVMLDRDNFSPGCIDGRFGHQTAFALRAWQRQAGLVASGEIDDAVRARLPAESDAFTSHTVTAADHAGLAEVPRTWAGKAQAAALPHATVLERLGEQYHASQRALRELNPSAGWPDPPAGTLLRVPNVTPYPKMPAARIEIHLAGKYLQAFGYDGKLVAHFPCSIAKDKAKRPVGELHIANAAADPNYTFKPELFAEDPEAASLKRRLVIPPGPNNPVGVAWLSLDRPGYGIHGTPHPEDIGKTESHGCFRLANWNARKLLDMISVGLPVTVFD